MAELNASAPGRKKRPGVKKTTKRSTRVDLTPMVDLGFLLNTFFIFTTTMSSPKSMKLNLPMDSTDSTKVAERGALTLIPAGEDALYFYEGKLSSQLQVLPFRSLRSIIQNKQSTTKPTDLMVIIKPTKQCSYKNTIATLDEMTINQVRRYTLADLSLAEYNLVEKLEIK